MMIHERQGIEALAVILFVNAYEERKFIQLVRLSPTKSYFF